MTKGNRNIKNIFIMLQIMANQVKTPIQNRGPGWLNELGRWI